MAQQLSPKERASLFHVTVGVRTGCNYECSYCVARNQIEKTSVHSVERLAGFLDPLPRPLVVELECGGAEPTLHPQIRDLLEVIVERGIASIPTNNSIPLQRWMPRNHPRRLHLRAGLHPEGESDLDGFLERLLRARELGAEVEVGFVAHPTRVSKMADYAAYFAAHRIPFHVRPFIGVYDGKRYPADHTDVELAPMSLYHRVYSAIENRDFYGIPCLAGYRALFVNPEGQLQRCLYDTRVLTAPLSEPKPCGVHQCCSGLLLEPLNMLDMFEEGHLLYRMAGLTPPSPARPHTPAALRRCEALYAALMRASGKHMDAGPATRDDAISVRLFEADATELERYFYGPDPGEVVAGNAGELRMLPTCTSDHVATPFFDVVPQSRSGYSWLQLGFDFPDGVGPARTLVAALQDPSFVTISEIVTLASLQPLAGGRRVHFAQIPPDVGRLRMMLQTECSEATSLPSYVSINHVGGDYA